MSDSSTNAIKPLTTIGAQDLTQLGLTKNGFLRKEGKIERELSKLGKVAGSFKWRRKYIILSKGCIYVYDSEDSTSPKTAFSLTGYNRVVRYESSLPQVRHAFQIILPGITDRRRTFSATSEDERLDWMRAVYEMMLFANAIPSPERRVLQTYNYDKLEKPIFEDDLTKRFSKAVKSLDEEPDSSDDGDYDKIEEKKMSARYRPLPKTPNTPSTSESDEEETRRVKLPTQEPLKHRSKLFSSGSEKIEQHQPKTPSPEPGYLKASRKSDNLLVFKPKIPSPEPEEPKSPGELVQQLPEYQNEKGKMPRPAVAPKPVVKPKPPPSTLTELYEDVDVGNFKPCPLTPADYECEDFDREKPKEMLKDKPLGTFLIRPSKTDPSKVLVVQAKDGIKNFKIYTQVNEFTLDKTNTFPTIRDLIEHYRISNLPHTDFKLSNGYKS